MPEEIKEKILRSLKEIPDKKISISELQRIINDFSYPTILKWVLILQAEGKIIIEDYGNVKLIKLNSDYNG